MARYIDAEKLINNIDALVINSQDVMFIRKLIADLETEDVKPVAPAHWIVTKLSTKWIFVCSHCHEGWYERYEDDNIIWKYCPNCGAKMDSDVDG